MSLIIQNVNYYTSQITFCDYKSSIEGRAILKTNKIYKNRTISFSKNIGTNEATSLIVLKYSFGLYQTYKWDNRILDLGVFIEGIPDNTSIAYYSSEEELGSPRLLNINI